MSLKKEQTTQLPSQSNFHLKNVYNLKNSRNTSPTTVCSGNQTNGPVKTSKNIKLCYINEFERFRMLRQKFKQRIQKWDETAVNTKKQHFDQIQTNKSEVLSDFNRNLLRNLKSQRNHTETVIQQTLNRCKSLRQQLGQPVNHMEELRLLEQSMGKYLKDLQK